MSQNETTTQETLDRLRANERILDQHYRSLALFQHPKSTRLYAVLAAYDSFAVPMMLMGTDPASNIMNKRLEEGLGQALRWVLSEDDPATSIAAECTPARLNDAGFFILYSSDYIDIADMHIMHGRGLVSLDSPDIHTINFIPDAGNTKDLIGFLETVESSRQRAQSAFDQPRKVAEKLARRLHRARHALVGGRITFPSFRCYNDIDIVNEVSPYVPLPPFQLDPGTDLEGFSAGELRRFWVALYFWSMMSIGRFLSLVRERIPQHQCMPVQLENRSDFVSKLSLLSRLSEDVADLILSRFSSTPGTRSDPTVRPFICIEDQIAWSNLYALSFRPERNMLKAMARTPALKGIADNLIGSRESNVARTIAKHLKKQGYRTKCGMKISSKTESGEIDILSWRTSCPNEVLLVEIKASLAPDEINEVNSLTITLTEGQEQLDKCIRILAAAPVEDKQAWFPFVDWTRATECLGIVVSAEGEANSNIDDSKFPTIAATTLMARVRRNSYFKSPATLVAHVRERAWFGDNLIEKFGQKTIEVGDLRYGLPEVSLSRREQP